MRGALARRARSKTIAEVMAIPTLRYTEGIVYARQPNADDGFRGIHYVNVIKDYSGRGT